MKMMVMELSISLAICNNLKNDLLKEMQHTGSLLICVAN